MNHVVLLFGPSVRAISNSQDIKVHYSRPFIQTMLGFPIRPSVCVLIIVFNRLNETTTKLPSILLLNGVLILNNRLTSVLASINEYNQWLRRVCGICFTSKLTKVYYMLTSSTCSFDFPVVLANLSSTGFTNDHRTRTPEHRADHFGSLFLFAKQATSR